MSRYSKHPPPPLPGLSDSKRDRVDDEESNAALIAQALNTDGTPKRPMNAFMIFARRRRPQVSAENQSMRTGEISKLLSKEWTTMIPELKQFYVDRAKELKDAFNAAYPDYVYRRRPNNSRRRRARDTGADVAAADLSHNSDEEDVKSSEESYLGYGSDSRRHDSIHSPGYDATSYTPRAGQTGPSPRVAPIVTNGYGGSPYYPSSAASGGYSENSSSNWSHSRGERGTPASWTADRHSSTYPPTSAGTTASSWSSTGSGGARSAAYNAYPSLTHSSYYPPTSPGASSETTSSPVYRERTTTAGTTASSASPPPTYSATGGVSIDRLFHGRNGGDSAPSPAFSYSSPSSTSRPSSAAVGARGGLPSVSDGFPGAAGYPDSHRR